MSNKSITGKITFIHHEKNRAVIEYMDNDRKRTIQADISIKEQEKLKEQKIIKKIHRYIVGDNVSFEIKKTGANGSQQYAANLQYQFNTALELLINKAATENKFLGYIKITDDKYFIKEINSYLFFPLDISLYEIPPVTETEQAVPFKLENIGKPEKIVASLYNHNYIPEFLSAIKYFKKEEVIDAVVTRISSFGIHLTLVNGKIAAKLTLDKALEQKIADGSIQVNTVIPVKIKHISSSRIVVETA